MKQLRQVRNGSILFNSMLFTANVLDEHENEMVNVKLLPDGKTLAVYRLNDNKLICKTKLVWCPSNRISEGGGRRLFFSKDAQVKFNEVQLNSLPNGRFSMEFDVSAKRFEFSSKATHEIFDFLKMVFAIEQD